MAADKKDWIAMVGDTAQSQMDKELVAWIDSIPFSKPARNLTRDFSDAGNVHYSRSHRESVLRSFLYR